MTARLTVLYGRDADAYLVARDADRALEGAGYHVSVEEACDEETGAPTGEHEVWLRRHGEPATKATRFLPGQLLVVESSGTWRIEDAAPESATTPYLNALREARRKAVADWRSALDALASRIDDEAQDVVFGLIAACDAAREVFVGAHIRVGAEEFQVRMVPVLGRRGDQLPKESAA